MSHCFTIVDAPQRSPAWFAARAGRATGSRAKDILATIKTGEAAARRDYRFELICERLTGLPAEGDNYVNAAIQWGLDHEDEACSTLEALAGLLVSKSGFLAHNDLMIGCSLDGHLGDFEGIAEVKCPKSATHCRYIRGPAEIPGEHLPQVLHNLYVTGAAWCDFLSFDPRMPAHLRTFYVRYYRNEHDIEAYAAKLHAFLDDVHREHQAMLGWHAVEAAHV